MLSRLGPKELLKLAERHCITPLVSQFHKGQNGRVCIIGGCEDYTGAPYFSAHATALMGCDLTHVICERGAAPVIKSYSPNLMVHPYLCSGTVSDIGDMRGILQNIHVLVIGPGLGRTLPLLKSVKGIIRYVLNEHKGMIPIVMDADALYLLSHDKEVREMVRSFPMGRIIITPNVVEFQRVYNSIINDIDDLEAIKKENIKIKNDQNDLDKMTAYVAQNLKCVVVSKGFEDKIFSPIDSHNPLINTTEGSFKRVGGQGDTLTGTIACMLAYSRAMYDFDICKGIDSIPEVEKLPSFVDYSMLSCFVGSTITRKCAHSAYLAKGRAMQTTDLNDRVGEMYEELFGK